MSRKPQGLRLDPSSAARPPVLQEPVELRERNRLGLPSDIVKAAKWLESADDERFVLAVLTEPGKLVLLPWAPDGQRVLEERSQLAASGDLHTLRLFEDRYRRIQVAQDGRITLTLSLMLHLGLPHDVDGVVHVAFLGNSIEVFSQSYRERELLRSGILFAGLP